MLLHLQKTDATEQSTAKKQGESRGPHPTLLASYFPKKDHDVHQKRVHHRSSRHYPFLVAQHPGFLPGDKETDNTLGSVNGIAPASLPKTLIHSLFSPLLKSSH